MYDEGRESALRGEQHNLILQLHPHTPSAMLPSRYVNNGRRSEWGHGENVLVVNTFVWLSTSADLHESSTYSLRPLESHVMNVSFERNYCDSESKYDQSIVNHLCGQKLPNDEFSHIPHTIAYKCYFTSEYWICTMRFFSIYSPRLLQYILLKKLNRPRKRMCKYANITLRFLTKTTSTCKNRIDH